MSQTNHGHGIKRTVRQACLIVAGMCLFVVALVPLYDLFCEITGLGGKTGDQYTYDPATIQPDTSRLIKVNFITNTNEGMSWQFWSEKGGMRVHPGELKEVNFTLKTPQTR